MKWIDYSPLFLIFALCLQCWAKPVPLQPEEMTSVAKIGKAIHQLHPNLAEHKYLQYAVGIYRASVRYALDPNLLVAIAHQETSFRENLPEGKAGELGICQIRKIWIDNPKFRKEFPAAQKGDLLNPEKSFLFAAWILSDLRKSVKNHTIPYWSYYNAVSFGPRLRYYIAVNRYLSAIRTGKSTTTRSRISNAALDEESTWTPEPHFQKAEKTVFLQSRRTSSMSYHQQPVPAMNEPMKQNGWIPAALRRLHNERTHNSIANGNTQRGSLSPSIIRAAVELDVPALFGSLPVKD